MRKRVTAFINFFHFPFLQFIPSVTFRYLFCGVSTVVVDLIVYYISFHYIFDGNNFFINTQSLAVFNSKIIDQGITVTPKIAALGISMIASFIWGFTLNKYVVFTESKIRGRIQLFRYGLIAATCIVLNFLLMKYFMNFLDFLPTVKRFFITVIVAVYSYLIQRRFTFK